tara:strand:+ start:821 stop:1243 length:423 start_codon:yes stop_codon:yes gene_type:complete
MAEISSVAVDVDKSTEGVWFDYDNGIRLKIASISNPKFTEWIRTKIGKSPSRRRRDLNAFDTPEMREGVALHVLKDWGDDTTFDGKKRKYTPAFGKELFDDPRYKSFYFDVLGFAGDVEAFRTECVEADAGNSEASSNGD